MTSHRTPKPPMTTHHHKRFVLFLAIAAALTTPSFAADPEPPLDPGESLWCLYFKEYMPPNQSGSDRSDLNFYMLLRQGRIVHAVASAPRWNKSCHAVDVSKLTCADDRLGGTVDITFHADGHVPQDGRPVGGRLTLSALLDRGDPGAEEAIDGRYEGTFGKEQVSGRLVGRVTPADRTSFKAARYWYRVFGVLVGSTDDPRARDITIELDVRDGRPTGARFTPHGKRGAEKVTLPLAVADIELAVDQSTAEYTFTYPVLGNEGGAKATYDLKVDVKRVHDLLGGEFEATVKQPGKPKGVRRGAVRGHCDPAAE